MLLYVHIGIFFFVLLLFWQKKIHRIHGNSFPNAKKPPTETMELLLDEVLHEKSKIMVKKVKN